MVVREDTNRPRQTATDLRGNELETRVLPPSLLVDDVLNFGVRLREWRIEHFILNTPVRCVVCFIIGFGKKREN